MPSEESWVEACHEAGHATISAIHWPLTEPGGMRIYNSLCDSTYSVWLGTAPERKHLLHCLVALGGTVGEELFASAPIRSVTFYTDGKQFAKDLQGAYLINSLTAEDAESALRPLVRQLLKKNDRLFFQLANFVHQRQHCFAEDTKAICTLYRKQFGVHGGPLMAQDWRHAFRMELESEVAMREVEAKFQAHQAPANGTPPLGPIEYKISDDSAILSIN